MEGYEPSEWPQMLIRFIFDNCIDVDSLPEDVREQLDYLLTRNKDDGVRREAALRGLGDLATLAKDKSVRVRLGVAKYGAELDTLINDEDEAVRRVAKGTRERARGAKQ